MTAHHGAEEFEDVGEHLLVEENGPKEMLKNLRGLKLDCYTNGRARLMGLLLVLQVCDLEKPEQISQKIIFKLNQRLP